MSLSLIDICARVTPEQRSLLLHLLAYYPHADALRRTETVEQIEMLADSLYDECVSAHHLCDIPSWPLDGPQPRKGEAAERLRLGHAAITSAITSAVADALGDEWEPVLQDTGWLIARAEVDATDEEVIMRDDGHTYYIDYDDRECDTPCSHRDLSGLRDAIERIAASLGSSVIRSWTGDDYSEHYRDHMERLAADAVRAAGGQDIFFGGVLASANACITEAALTPA